MRKSLFRFVAGAALLATGAALADPAPVLGPLKDADGKPLPFGIPVYHKADVPLGTGPFKAIMAEDASLPDHTLYYPADLAAAGKLPIIVWGNGACLNAGNRFRIMLTETASHGFLIVAGGPIAAVKYEVGPQENPAMNAFTGPRPTTPPAPPPPPKPGDATGRNTAPQLVAGLDWAIKENDRPGSKFYHRLDTNAVGVAGQSCGGILATTVSADPRIKTTALFSGAPFLQAQTNPPPGAPPTVDTKTQLGAIHAPIMLLAGDATHDIAHAATLADIAYIEKVPVFMAWEDGLSHIGTYGMKDGGEMARLGWQWFAWRLRGDANAAKVFTGKDCGLCGEAGWHITKKKMN